MHRSGIVITVIAACLLLLPALSGNAAPSASRDPGEGSVGIGLGYLNGNTLYHISVSDATGGVESELEFPLEAMLFGLAFGYVGRDDKGLERFSLQLQWFMNADRGSGVLKDSDWLWGKPEIDLVGTAHPGLDIYSESDISLKAHIIDLRASYNAWQSGRWCIGPLAGFLYEKFSFDASNVNQVGYGPYAGGYTLFSPGPVLTYEATYAIPYLGVHAGSRFGSSLSATADVGYTPVASAWDKDDHLLRSKISEGSTMGSAYLITLAAQWEPWNDHFLQLSGQYVGISTTGTQTQTWYADETTSTGTIPAGTTISGINDRIESHQTSATLVYRYRF